MDRHGTARFPVTIHGTASGIPIPISQLHQADRQRLLWALHPSGPMTICTSAAERTLELFLKDKPRYRSGVHCLTAQGSKSALTRRLQKKLASLRALQAGCGLLPEGALWCMAGCWLIAASCSAAATCAGSLCSVVRNTACASL